MPTNTKAITKISEKSVLVKQKTLEGNSIEMPIEIPAEEDWIDFLQSSKSNFNTVISPSKFPEGDYSFVQKGTEVIDYKGTTGEKEVNFMALKDLKTGRISKLKVTPTLVDYLKDVEFNILTEPFHYSVKIINKFTYIVDISLYESS